MTKLECLVFKLVAIDALLARPVAIQKVAALDHKVPHDAVKQAALVSDGRVVDPVSSPIQ